MATLGGPARVPTLIYRSSFPLCGAHFLIGLTYFAGKSFGTETFKQGMFC